MHVAWISREIRGHPESNAPRSGLRHAYKFLMPGRLLSGMPGQLFRGATQAIRRRGETGRAPGW
jgi:hypothetical protein